MDNLTVDRALSEVEDVATGKSEWWSTTAAQLRAEVLAREVRRLRRTQKLSAYEVEMLRDALGLSTEPVSFRNYFCACDETRAAWESLRSRGFAACETDVRAIKRSSGLSTYVVLRSAIGQVLRPFERISAHVLREIDGWAGSAP